MFLLPGPSPKSLCPPRPCQFNFRSRSIGMNVTTAGVANAIKRQSSLLIQFINYTWRRTKPHVWAPALFVSYLPVYFFLKVLFVRFIRVCWRESFRISDVLTRGDIFLKTAVLSNQNIWSRPTIWATADTWRHKIWTCSLCEWKMLPHRTYGSRECMKMKLRYFCIKFSSSESLCIWQAMGPSTKKGSLRSHHESTLNVYVHRQSCILLHCKILSLNNKKAHLSQADVTYAHDISHIILHSSKLNILHCIYNNVNEAFHWRTPINWRLTRLLQEQLAAQTVKSLATSVSHSRSSISRLELWMGQILRGWGGMLTTYCKSMKVTGVWVSQCHHKHY